MNAWIVLYKDESDTGLFLEFNHMQRDQAVWLAAQAADSGEATFVDCYEVEN